MATKTKSAHPNKTQKFWLSAISAATLAALAGGSLLRYDAKKKVQNTKIVKTVDDDGTGGQSVHGQSLNMFQKAKWVQVAKTTRPATYYKITKAGEQALADFKSRTKVKKAKPAKEAPAEQTA